MRLWVALVVLCVAVGVTTSAALLFLLGGAAPLIGIYGTFDENDIASP